MPGRPIPSQTLMNPAMNPDRSSWERTGHTFNNAYAPGRSPGGNQVRDIPVTPADSSRLQPRDHMPTFKAGNETADTRQPGLNHRMTPNSTPCAPSTIARSVVD